METILLWVLVLLVAALIGVKFGVKKPKPHAPETADNFINTSGIYSVVHKSPRMNIATAKPSPEEIRKYLAEKNENSSIDAGFKSTIDGLAQQWNTQLEAAISVIEIGDKKGVEFYTYEFIGDDPVCSPFIKKGNFVSRRQLYSLPELIPPFHLGCTCTLRSYEGKGNIADTAQFPVAPIVHRDNTAPPLPHWQKILNPVPTGSSVQ